MGATYTRQSSYTDGDVITAAHTNDEFNQLLAAFQASTGHTHDGTANEGGPITKLLGNTLTFGAGTAGTDITITFDGETSDGVLKWMEDEDYFDSLLVTEVFTPDGNWSSYPSHRHDEDDFPNITYLEETYYHRINNKSQPNLNINF